MAPAPGVTPRMRRTLGFSLLSCSSTLAVVTPYSSASIMADSDQRTILSHASSPWRTKGPRGSFEMISGSTT
ncbi:Uncharacterised protein [Bordetella pertussis]|nr:Uncharacterised protein [Bordetella pertussis]